VRQRLTYFFCLLLPATAVADVLFSDSSIDLANYTATPVYIDPGVTLKYQNCPDCGNPGAGLQELVTTPPYIGGSVSFGLINNDFVYNPATEGAIGSIGVSVDQNVSFNRSPGGGFYTVFVPLLEQGGNYYMTVLYGNGFAPGDTTEGYQTLSETGLMAADFGQVVFSTTTNLINSYNPYANPDFSGTGAPIQVGLVPVISLNDQFSVEADYANLGFDITPVTSVPEPATAAPVALLAGGWVLSGLVLYAFRRFTQAGSRPD
jgi:hypothetical protein